MSYTTSFFFIFFVILASEKQIFAMDTDQEKTANQCKIMYATRYDQGSRETFEDTYFPNAFSTSSSIADNTHFFGIYDGHGGTDCALHLAACLHKEIKGTDGFEKEDIQSALLVGYEKCNEVFRRLINDEPQCREGSTAATALFRGSELWVANVGDSEIVLCCENKKARCLTEQHIACNEQEMLRVELLGGTIVYRGRVKMTYLEHYESSYEINPRIIYRLENPHNEKLSVISTRSFGDYAYKPFLIATPFVQKIELSSPGFIILASDGLWDTMSYQAAVDTVLDQLEKNGKTIATVDEETAESATEFLVEKALEISYFDVPKEKITIATADNITVTIVFFSF